MRLDNNQKTLQYSSLKIDSAHFAESFSDELFEIVACDLG